MEQFSKEHRLTLIGGNFPQIGGASCAVAEQHYHGGRKIVIGTSVSLILYIHLFVINSLILYS